MLRIRSSLIRMELAFSKVFVPRPASIRNGAPVPGPSHLSYTATKPRLPVLSGCRNRVRVLSFSGQGRVFSTSIVSQNNQDQPSTTSSFDDVETDNYQMSPSIRRRPYNLEAKMRMKQYRREAEQQRRQKELEEEERTFQLDYSKMYKKGDAGTVQAVIKEIVNVGYIVTLPNGTEGFLAAMHLGCSGGITLLERLMAVGSEVAVRVIEVPHPGGRHRCYVRP